MVPGQPAGAGQTAPIRIRPSQPELHHHQQAQAQATGRREAREWLGRSTHVDAVGLPSPRLYAGVDPQLLRHDRCEPRWRRGGYRHAGIRHPRGSGCQRGAGHVRTQAAEGGDHQLPGRPGRKPRIAAPSQAGHGCARPAVQPRNLYRRQRLRRSPAGRLQAPDSRWRSAPARQLRDPRRRGGEG